MNPKSRERLSIMAFAIISLVVVGAGFLLRRCPRQEAAPPVETIIFSSEENGSNESNGNYGNNGSNGSNGKGSRKTPKTPINPINPITPKAKAKGKANAKPKAKASKGHKAVPSAAPRDYLNDTIKTVK